MYINRSTVQAFRSIVRAAFHITPRSSRPTIQLAPQQDRVLLHAELDGVDVTVLASSASGLSRPLSIRYDDLKQWQARRGSITMEETDGGAEVHWRNGAIPVSTVLSATEPVAGRLWVEDLPEADLFLLHALSEASQVTDQESLRYALGCIQLDGEQGTVTGTDGRQLLMFDGFHFPWGDQAILVRANAAFSLAAIADAKSAHCGVVGDQFVLRSGVCQLKLPIQREGRFPNVRQIIPQSADAKNDVHLHPLDAQFLRANVTRLPGAEREYAPVNVDLNGHVAVVGWDPESRRSTEVVLSRSIHHGPDVCWAANRQFLKRAAGLGAYRMYGFGANRPVLCRGKRTQYVWMPLAGEKSIPAEATTQRIATLPTAA